MLRQGLDVEDEDGAIPPEAHLVAMHELGRPGEAVAVDEGAIGTAAVGDGEGQPRLMSDLNHRMAPTDEIVLDRIVDYRRAGITANHDLAHRVDVKLLDSDSACYPTHGGREFSSWWHSRKRILFIGDETSQIR